MAKVPSVIKEKISSRWLNRILISFVVVSVAGASILFLIVEKRTEESLAEQILHRQQIVARAGAKSIESFLKLASKSLSLLTKDYYLANQKLDTQIVLEGFVADWQDTPIVETIVTDSEGIVRYLANKANTGMKEGVSVADRDYLIASKNAPEGEIFFGEPILPRLGAFEGQYIIPIATSIHSDGEFKGVMGAAILLSELTRTYLDPLRISEETRIYLMDANGNILHAPYEKFIGENYFDYLASIEFEGKEEAVGQFWKAISIPEEGKIDVKLPNEVTGKLDRFLVSYSPIKYEGQHWNLAVASPIKDALVFFPQFHGHQTAALVFMVFAVIGIVALGILTARVAQRETYLKGFALGRDHKNHQHKSKKAKS